MSIQVGDTVAITDIHNPKAGFCMMGKVDALPESNGGGYYHIDCGLTVLGNGEGQPLMCIRTPVEVQELPK